jgi:hypothetical protein
LLDELTGGKVSPRTAVYKMLKRERSICEIQSWQTERAAMAETLMRESRITLSEKTPVARSQEVAVVRPDLKVPHFPRRGFDQASKRRVRIRPAVPSGKRSDSPGPVPLAPLPELD